MGLPIRFFGVGFLAISASFANAQFSKPTVQEQITLGQRVAEDLRKNEKVLPANDPHVVMLRRVATRVLSSIHDDEAWAFSFDVIDSPVVNAFALPGGPTFFYTGLMDKLKTEDELAGVLSHELTHVRLQHWATQYAATQKRDLLINLGLIISKANYAVSEIAGLTDELAFNLPFTRNEESQADRGGFHLMVQAGYNPHGMVSVFEMFSKTLKTGGEPTFLSDHPADQVRIDKLDELIKEDNRTYPPEIPVTY